MTVRSNFTATCLRLLLAAAASTPASGGDKFFDMTELKGTGRQVAAEFADVNGDGRRDLFVISLSGIPPKEHREISVYLQREDRRFRPGLIIDESCLAGVPCTTLLMCAATAPARS